MNTEDRANIQPAIDIECRTKLTPENILNKVDRNEGVVIKPKQGNVCVDRKWLTVGSPHILIICFPGNIMGNGVSLRH